MGEFPLKLLQQLLKCLMDNNNKIYLQMAEIGQFLINHATNKFNNSLKFKKVLKQCNNLINFTIIS